MRGHFQKIGLLVLGVVAGILISLNFSASAEKDGSSALPIEELRAFAEVFNAIKEGYVEPIDDKQLITHAISGMLSNLDPHSAYLDSDAFKDLQVSTQGEFGGLGIEVGMEDGFIKVVAPIDDTPAFRAGVKPGDLIIKLDDTMVKGLTLNEAVKLMRGKPKTQITLTIMRKGETAPIVLTLTREKIRVQSVKHKMLEAGYGYLRVSQFQEETVPDLVKALDKLYAQEKEGLRGLVLDLRNDPGGLLHGAVGVAAAFLPEKALIVSTDGRTEDSRRKFYAIPDDYLRGNREDVLRDLPAAVKSVPLIVLVNGGSASASEIVAGALQDHKRAMVLGTQTFGKASVQTILPLSNSTAIKLTTARYYTPNGRSIQAKGIVPDMTVEESPNGGASVRLREADLQRHLANDREKEADKQAGPAQQPQERKNGDPAAKPVPFELASKDDYQLNQAVGLLKAWQIIKQR